MERITPNLRGIKPQQKGCLQICHFGRAQLRWLILLYEASALAVQVNWRIHLQNVSLAHVAGELVPAGGSKPSQVCWPGALAPVHRAAWPWELHHGSWILKTVFEHQKIDGTGLTETCSVPSSYRAHSGSR